MKYIYLLRHAKATKEQLEAKDFDRDLNGKGIVQANVSAYFMKWNAYLPEVVYCSAAKRTKRTFEILSPPLFISSKAVNYKEDLYLCGWKKIIDTIQNTNNEFEKVLLVGHNFGISEALSALINEDKEMSTADVAILSLDIDHWDEVSPGTAFLADYFSPQIKM